MKNIPENFQYLLQDQTRAFADLATVMPDGGPQLSVVWFNTDGEQIIINTARGRFIDRNMKANPRVALVIQDPQNPYRYIQIRGKVVQATEQGAEKHIDDLSRKYTGNAFQFRPGEVRVIYVIEPQRVTTYRE